MLFVFCYLFCSCTDSLENSKRVEIDDSSPNEVTRNLHLFYSDSARVKIELLAAYSERSSQLKERTIFKDSLRLNFFDDEGNKTTTLSALYGEFNDANETIFVRDSVRLYNFEKQQLLMTNSLNWNKKDSTIHTQDTVWVQSPEGIARGKGITTKQDFREYKILFPEGNLLLNEKK